MENTSLKDNANWGPAIGKGAFLILTVALIVSVIYILQSVLHAIILGMIFALLLMPLCTFLHKTLILAAQRLQRAPKSSLTAAQLEIRRRKLERRTRSLASLLSILILLAVVAVPASMFAASIVRQGYNATMSAQTWIVNELPGKTRDIIEKYNLKDKLDIVTAMYQGLASGKADDADAARDDTAPANDGAPDDSVIQAHANFNAAEDIGPFIASIASKFIGIVRDTILTVLSEVGVLIFNICIMLFVMYQFFYDGKNIAAYLKSISPLDDDAQQRVAKRIGEVCRAIFFGILGTAVAQGLCAMLAFSLADIPAFWGIILGLCSIIPIVGTSIIWIPVVIYLLMTGAPGRALFIFISCGCVVANFDMILRPLLMKKSGETGMSYMVLFLSILGGIQTFGLVGIIYGPLITGICSICLLIFSTQFKSRKIQQPTQQEPPK